MGGGAHAQHLKRLGGRRVDRRGEDGADRSGSIFYTPDESLVASGMVRWRHVTCAADEAH